MLCILMTSQCQSGRSDGIDDYGVLKPRNDLCVCINDIKYQSSEIIINVNDIINDNSNENIVVTSNQ